jgi:hypothetical protein
VDAFASTDGRCQQAVPHQNELRDLLGPSGRCMDDVADQDLEKDTRGHDTKQQAADHDQRVLDPAAEPRQTELNLNQFHSSNPFSHCNRPPDLSTVMPGLAPCIRVSVLQARREMAET